MLDEVPTVLGFVAYPLVFCYQYFLSVVKFRKSTLKNQQSGNTNFLKFVSTWVLLVIKNRVGDL